ncbi:double-strand break repair helicase AddA, partial [Thalassobaculum sp.]|uniref:double-strand break repair helicase AddA n=1 Tax=Thalassobaculum sp. TaxID=2022740 RepID=UPI0032ED3B2C
MTDATVIALAGERQRQAADPAASAWVAASAGSGKTKVLTDRLLNLLLDGASPERLLCLTYTKAAAAEMATRLQTRLAAWTVVPEPKLVDDLAGLSGAVPSRARLAKARRLFAEVLDAPGGLKIQTIHAFAQSLLGRFPLEAGVPPHFRLADDRASAVLLAEAEAAVLARAHSGGDPALADALGTVTEKAGQEQFRDLMRAALAARTRLTAALAATGGVDGMAAAIHARLGVEPGQSDRDLLLAACRDGAVDAPALRRAAEALAHGSKTDIERGTVLADWLALGDPVRRAAAWEDYRGVFLTATDGRPRKTLATKGALGFDAGAGDALAVEAERLVAVEAVLRALATATRTAALVTLAAAVIAAYEAAKARRAELDYEDLVERARSLLRRPGVAAWVLFKLDGGLDHVLIDEAQDTSPAQWDIVRALAEEFFAGTGAHDARHPQVERTIFAVGDVKQSIYSFQGADPAGFGAARGHFATRVADAGKLFRRVPLEQSFRSTDAVLQAVDAVFALPEARDGVAEIEADGGAVPIVHNAVRSGHAGRVEVWPPVDPVEAEPSAPWTPPVERRGADEPRARLAQRIAERIGGWIGTELLAARGRTVQPGDVLVLVQRRGAFVHELVAALKKAGVPVAGVDRLVLTDQMAVKDLVALGRAVLLPEDDLTLATVLKGPLVGLTEDQLYDLCQGRTQPRVWRELQRRAAEGGAFAEARRRLGDWLRLADRVPPHDFFQRVLARGGRERLVRRLGPEAEDAIDELLAQALAYERESTPSLQGFLHWLAAGDFEVKRELEGAGGTVRVMTVHGAKGLQAPIVVLPDTLRVPRLQDQWLWHAAGDGTEIPLWTASSREADEVSAAARAEARRRQDQEYRRLLYVAMTRAEDRLVVCGWNGRKAATAGNWYELIHRAVAPLAEDRPDPADPAAPPLLVLETA